MRRTTKTILLVLLLLIVPLAGCTGDDGGRDGDDDPDNQPPTARFNQSCEGLECTFDATGSEDPDGTITTVTWAFGDGGNATGATATHGYASEGTYNVVVTVRDDDGATDTDQRTVAVASGDGDDEATPPDDYHARYDGSVGPGFDRTWFLPVNDTSVQRLHVTFNITADPFPTGAASIELILEHPNGTTARAGNVTAAEPNVTWELGPDEAALVGNWLLTAQGEGLGDEMLGGTRFQLALDVEYF